MEVEVGKVTVELDNLQVVLLRILLKRHIEACKKSGQRYKTADEINTILMKATQAQIELLAKIFKPIS